MYLAQLIHEPTHVAGNTLDLAFSDIDHNHISTTVIKPGVSDHFMVEVLITTEFTYFSAKPKTNILWHEADQDGFQQDLIEIHSRMSKYIDPGRGRY